MNQNRVNSIKKLFEGVGPDGTSLYTHQEIVDLLQDIQKTMLEGVYEKTHAEYMREKDLMLHFATLAEQYGLKATDIYKRFEKNMKDLSYTIGSYIKGMKGEQIARKALKLIGYDKNVKVLYNVALEDEDVQAEYDAIVITPYGIFVVEVKNWGTEIHIDENGILKRVDKSVQYDLPGRMCIKEALLRKYLGDIFPDKYQGIVLFPNESTKVKDEFMQVPICCGGGMVYKIRKYDEGKNILTVEQIEEIVSRINSHHKEQKTLCKVNCDVIIDDYALLMSAIEEAAEGIFTTCEELKNMGGEVHPLEQLEGIANLMKKQWRKAEGGQKNRCFVGGVVGLLVAFGIGFSTAKNIVAQR